MSFYAPLLLPTLKWHEAESDVNCLISVFSNAFSKCENVLKLYQSECYLHKFYPVPEAY